MTTTLRLPAIYSEDLRSGNVRVGFRAPVTRRKIQRTFDYLNDGETWAEEARVAVVAGLAAGRPLDDLIVEVMGRTTSPATAPAPTPGTSGTLTLSAYARTWLKARHGSVERSTWSGYETHVDKILADRGDDDWAAIGTRPIAEITRTEVEAWRTRMADAGTNAPTLNARLKVLRMVFRWALSDRLIPSDPTEALDFRPTPVVEKTTLDDESEARLLAECKTDADRLLVRLGLYAGLRWSEASALTPGALVEPGDGRAYLVIRQVRRRDGSVKPYTKDGKWRRVAMFDDETLRLFRRVALPVERDALMFPWSYDNYRHRVWKGNTRRAGLSGHGRRFGFHQLRHTCATRMSALNVPRTEIAEFLGHADESTTAGYIHATNDGARFDLISAAFARRTG